MIAQFTELSIVTTTATTTIKKRHNTQLKIYE